MSAIQENDMTNTSRLEHCFTALKQQNRPSDPMADGPAIQKAALRALENGQTQAKTLEMVRQFREQNSTTPIVLMGYYNPIYCYGVERFLTDAAKAGAPMPSACPKCWPTLPGLSTTFPWRA